MYSVSNAQRKAENSRKYSTLPIAYSYHSSGVSRKINTSKIVIKISRQIFVRSFCKKTIFSTHSIFEQVFEEKTISFAKEEAQMVLNIPLKLTEKSLISYQYYLLSLIPNKSSRTSLYWAKMVF